MEDFIAEMKCSAKTKTLLQECYDEWMLEVEWTARAHFYKGYWYGITTGALIGLCALVITSWWWVF